MTMFWNGFFQIWSPKLVGVTIGILSLTAIIVGIIFIVATIVKALKGEKIP